MKRRVTLLAASVVAISGVAAIPAAQAAAGAKVQAVDFEFIAETVKISKGEKVTWKFLEGKHNVTGKGFKSGTKTSGKYSHKFTEKGTFKYRCTLHQPDMDGVVKVVK